MGAICTSAPLRSSTGRVSPASTCPGVDRPASGFVHVTYALSHVAPRHTLEGGVVAGIRFLYASGGDPLRLATCTNSPARVSRRTLRPRSSPLEEDVAIFPFEGTHFFRAAAPIATWFQALFTPIPRCFSAFPHGT